MPIGIDNQSAETVNITTTVISVANVDTAVLAANPLRRGLIIQRGTTVGRVFLHFGSDPATTTNGILMRENAYFELEMPLKYTGAIRAITVGSNKILYVTEVTV